jgi:glutamate-1-semialdehyde 2,1-aminomutase
MRAGIETIRLISSKGTFKRLEAKTLRLAEGLQEAAEKAFLSVQVPHLGGMISLFFSERPVMDLNSALASDTARFKRFFHGMLNRGIYLPPSAFEAWFVSLAHSDKEIRKTVKAAREVFQFLDVDTN